VTQERASGMRTNGEGHGLTSNYTLLNMYLFYMNYRRMSFADPDKVF